MNSYVLLFRCIIGCLRRSVKSMNTSTLSSNCFHWPPCEAFNSFSVVLLSLPTSCFRVTDLSLNYIMCELYLILSPLALFQSFSGTHCIVSHFPQSNWWHFDWGVRSLKKIRWKWSGVWLFLNSDFSVKWKVNVDRKPELITCPWQAFLWQLWPVAYFTAEYTQQRHSLIPKTFDQWDCKILEFWRLLCFVVNTIRSFMAGLLSLSINQIEFLIFL